MAEQLTKLNPARDLQCYFQEPSAIAAISGASASGFTVSGCWRQQFDWAVVEWNRDNVFEHPTLRNLPDGDLSGVQLSYQEARTNCIALDSALYPTVEWPYLRVWADASGIETLYDVPLRNYATPIGTYTAASVQFTLQGSPTAGDYIELAWLDQHFNYLIASGDTLVTAINNLAAAITANKSTGLVTATASGTEITLTYQAGAGSNANRIGVYGTVHGSGTESWAPSAANFAGGISPQQWTINLNFSSLVDKNGTSVPTTAVRKMRWTWSADLQPGTFQRSEFSVAITNWTVSGTKLQYCVAGPGSRRVEDDSTTIAYQGAWSKGVGNYSGGSIHWTTTPGDRLSCSYQANASHTLYLGSRLIADGGRVSVQVDGGAPVVFNLQLSGEDVLVRLVVMQSVAQGTHSITLTHSGAAGGNVFFDFLEIAYPSAALPIAGGMPQTALATDWDTDHSIALPPERTSWLISKLGFHGRVNHYAGALWFYELALSQNTYASGTVTFSGSPEFGKTTTVTISGTTISHLNLIGDTASSVAQCFAQLINAGSTGVWAQANGPVLTITGRAIGSAGNAITLSAATNSSAFGAALSAAALSGGVDGVWLTDLTASPRINRAARDWSTAYFQALMGYGISVTTSFSMELGNGDDSIATNIAQRYPDGTPAWLNTPALQTNFGPVSTAFWKEVYLEMAGLMAGAGVTPYLQFGEVQWWYFANASGMPFYDSYTTGAFQAQYGRPMATITSQNADPSAFPSETAFLPQLIGQFTGTIMTYVRQTYTNTRFEVLYPTDVNDTPLNHLINFPLAAWTAANLDSLKTENFTYTAERNLDLALESIELPMQLGFARSQSSHLIGISDYTTPWSKEQRLASGQQLDSVVLFALDQFCLIGYRLPLETAPRRARFMGH
jgi:hypothetical protein